MPWMESSTMSLRHEFVQLASQEGANIAMLAQRYSISRKTAYKWLSRFEAEGVSGLADRSRTPLRSPRTTPEHVEAAVLELRARHPAWGGRKLRRRLLDLLAQGRLSVPLLSADEVPAPSTITAILHRHGLITEEAIRQHQPMQRFEKERPNELWQMDFKGDFLLEDLTRCYPLTVLDDHSRFALTVEACSNQRKETVQERLRHTFRLYGLPERIITDHGSPWGVGMTRDGGGSYYTELSAWMMRLGVRVSFAGRAHPQTCGKNERFNGTLKAELLRFERFADLSRCQQRFRWWRELYNLERPHESLDLEVPASRYQVSPRVYPEVLPKVEYGPCDTVRKVQQNGTIHLRGRHYRVGKGFRGEPVAVRPTTEDGVFEVYYCHQKIRTLDLHEPST